MIDDPIFPPTRVSSHLSARLLAFPGQLWGSPYALIDRQVERKFRWLSLLWILSLYVAGVFFWGNFLNWGKTPLDFEDWGIINSPRLDFIQDSLRGGHLPLHMEYEKFLGQDHPLRRITDRFLSMPDIIATPQTLLLTRVDISTFVYIDLLIHFTVATFGLLWFRQKYNLSLLAYGFLFLLFQFNGYIQSHYGVGHITWAGYFLFPLLIALLIQFVEGAQNWTWVVKIAFLLFYMVLAGSEHHFVWVLIFLSVFALVCHDKLKWILVAGLFAGLLSAVRLLPPLLIVQDVERLNINQLLPGYPTLLDVLRSMTTLVQPAHRNFVDTGIAWLSHWEYDIYVGLAGSLFILYFGIFHWLRDIERFPVLQKLLAPALVVFLFTIGKMYAAVRALHIPLLEGERVPSRMIALPLTILIIVAVIYFQNWLDERRMPRQFALVLGTCMILLLGNDLWAHSKVWNLDTIRTAFGPVQMTLDGSSVINHFDRPYFVVILLGTLCSLLTGLFLLLRAWQERRRMAGSI